MSDPAPGSVVLQQMARAGLLKHLLYHEVHERSVTGTGDSNFIHVLRLHPKFIEGKLHGTRKPKKLHPDVGKDRTEFRSLRGSLGGGSLQVVVDQQTYKFYADIDEYNPYEIPEGFLGHTWEVIRGAFRKAWTWIRSYQT